MHDYCVLHKQKIAKLILLCGVYSGYIFLLQDNNLLHFAWVMKSAGLFSCRHLFILKFYIRMNLESINVGN